MLGLINNNLLSSASRPQSCDDKANREESRAFVFEKAVSNGISITFNIVLCNDYYDVNLMRNSIETARPA